MTSRKKAQEWDHVEIIAIPGRTGSAVDKEDGLLQCIDEEDAADDLRDEEEPEEGEMAAAEKGDGSLRHPEVQCKYCKHKFHGGATRIRQHLLGLKKDVKKCSNCPTVVKKALEEWIVKMAAEKEKKRRLAELDAETSAQAKDGGNAAKKRKGMLQATIGPLFKRTKQAEVDDAWEKAFVANGIAFNVARDPTFRAAVSLTARTADPNYQLPSYQALRGPLLDRARQALEKDLKVVTLLQ